MKSFLKKTIKLIPTEKRKRLPYFFVISFLNSILDFISIAVLAPYLLLLLDNSLAINFFEENFSITIKQSHIIASLVFLIFFFILKNYLQAKIIFKQSKFIYSIGSEISKKLIKNYFYGDYLGQITQDKGALLRDFQKLPIVFGNHILLSFYFILSEFFILLIIAIVSICIKPTTTLISILFITIGGFILLKLRNSKIEGLNVSIAKSYKETLNQIMNVFNGFLQIKSANSESEFEQRFTKSNESHNKQLSLLSAYKQSNIRYFEIIIIIGIALLILQTQLNNFIEIDFILLSFLISAIIKLIPSFNKIITSILDIKANKHTVDILSKYNLNTKINNDKNTFIKHIELNNVSFGYDTNSLILDKINIKITKGNFIAVTGKSGIGKTTLLRFITGLLPIKSGYFLIDNKKVNSTSFLPFISIVPQQPFLFKGSLKENIIMNSNQKLDLNHIYLLLELFELKDWFKNLKNGLETELDIDSKTLSGGQKQRIALIRALYSKPKILLLDEATNQLNESLEKKILTYLKQLCSKDKLTIIAVSHSKLILDYAGVYFNLETNSSISNE